MLLYIIVALAAAAPPALDVIIPPTMSFGRMWVTTVPSLETSANVCQSSSSL